jgi:hypothetical protein
LTVTAFAAAVVGAGCGAAAVWANAEVVAAKLRARPARRVFGREGCRSDRVTHFT